MDLSRRNRIRDIIEESTKHNVIVISHDIVTELKTLLRGDNVLIEFCCNQLFEKLMFNHSQTRLLALMLINVIFLRSKYFRQLIVNNLELLFECTLPINSKKALPAPSKTAVYLTEQSLEFIEDWLERFGLFYFRLKLGYDHLVKIHHIHFPNKKLHEKEKQKLAQINHIKKLKQKLQRFVELISKFNTKYPKIVTFLKEFEGKIDIITPKFNLILDDISHRKTTVVGFSDDENDENDENNESDDNEDDDLCLELPSNLIGDIYDDDDINNDDLNNETLDNYQQFGLQRGYSLKVTIDTNLENYLNKTDKNRNKNSEKEDKKQQMIEISTYRYLTEKKLMNQIESWRSILINADLNVITNKDKQLLFLNHRMKILKSLDDIHSKSIELVNRCNTLSIAAQQNNKKNHNNKRKKKRKLAPQYTQIKASLSFSNNRYEAIKQKELKRRMLTNNKKPNSSQIQRRRILFKIKKK